MTDMWAVTATVETKGDNGYTGMRQIPTFYLCERVQGFIDEEGAWLVAHDILSASRSDDRQFHITAVKVD